MQSLSPNPVDRHNLALLKQAIVREGGIANAAVMHPKALQRLLYAAAYLIIYENKYSSCDILLDGLRLLSDDRCPLDYVWVGDSAELENLEIP